MRLILAAAVMLLIVMVIVWIAYEIRADRKYRSQYRATVPDSKRQPPV